MEHGGYFQNGGVSFRHILNPITRVKEEPNMFEVEVIYFLKYKNNDPILRRVVLLAVNWNKDIKTLIDYWNSAETDFKFSTNYYDL